MERKLNVGSGNTPIIGDGWMNCDINPDCPSLDFVCELDEIPVGSDTFDEIKSTHSIEHIPFARGRKALSEWFRVLKSGGKLMVDTPNLKRNAAWYVSDSMDWLQDFNTLTKQEKEYVSINGVPNKTLWVNFKMFSSDAKWDVHYCNYDADLLMEFFKAAGFINVRVYALSPSLIVEGYKP